MLDETDGYNPGEQAVKIVDGIDNGSLPERPETGKSFFSLSDRQGNPLATLTSGQGGYVSGPVNPYQRHPDDPNREDPLFTVMAGRSGEFVNGIRKEDWDGLTPEQQDKLVRGTQKDRDEIAERFGHVGAGLGALAGYGVGSMYGVGPQIGSALQGVGGSVGFGLGSRLGQWIIENKKPPEAISRNELYKQYQDAIGRE